MLSIISYPQNQALQQPPNTPPAFAWFLLPLLLIGLAQWSRSITLDGAQMSAIWAPAGVFLGGCLALGYRALWVLIPALLVWSISLQNMSLVQAVAGTLGLTVGVSLATWLIRRHRAKVSHPLKQLNHLPNLYLYGAVIGAGVSSLLGSLAITNFSTEFARYSLQDLWLSYWLFEALGIILFAPVFVLVFSTPQLALREVINDLKERKIQIWLFLAATALFVSIILTRWGDARYAPVFSFALFPLICWYALTARPVSLHFWIPVFASIFVCFSIYNIGGLPPINDFEDLLRVLLQAGILSVMAQMLGSVNRHRFHLIERFENQAKEDLLTGLANERGLHEVIQQVLNSTHTLADSQQPWLACVKLPDLSAVNELLGYEGTADIESKLALLLRQVCPNAVIARLNQGKFAILQFARSASNIKTEAREIYAEILRCKRQNNIDITTRIAMGAIPIDGSLGGPTQYISAASHTTLIARDMVVSFHYIDAPSSTVKEHLTLADRFEQLKTATLNNELVLFGQEIKALTTADTGLYFEVLIRMRSHDGSIISPAEFLPAAEVYGFMPTLDRWVVENTLKLLALHSSTSHKTSYCAMNLSGASLSDPELASFIGSCMKRYAIAPERLMFEITETQTIRNPLQALNFIHDIHDLGAKVALDDFGTGLASFDYLCQYPFDELKIDGAFVQDLATNPVNKSIVAAICQVATTMNLKTVAEFVENEEIIDVLTELGVHYAQGYGIGKPKPLTEFFMPQA
ncbi:hypothetical protein CWE15_11140 [Aliidiomarina taiwanensis]|uniref:EAL domain-containing protein n=1 Tax=Aliidiomarina taiwanensis TaxID=946228 RepID=A0A432WVP3_9GAMM|nr:EAL domain-containing protein [Aliidiomarina taiwanensis]RUO37835.1 hypothetical protein CWE15_11140 [Aliidiomarina taiwanensis]